MKQDTFFEHATYDWSDDSIRLFPTVSEHTKELFFYAQELGHFKAFPSYYTERQNLNSYLIVYTISGEGLLTYDHCDYVLRAGDAFFINCNHYHKYLTNSRQNWEFLWLHMNGPLALGYYEESVSNGFHILHAPESASLRDPLTQLLELHREHSPQTVLLSCNLIQSILTIFLLYSCPLTPENGIPDQIVRARKYLEKHFREPICLDSLSSYVGVSKYHLSREFTRYMKTPINEYLILLRLSYGKELLRYSSLSISEICYACGMQEPAYFIRAFRKREGITPNQYRKQWKST